MLQALTTLAHEGHDHSYFLGGELHHWLWIAAGVAAVAVLVAPAVRRWFGR
ncbi:hypothetical protein [Algisphaera agarilytica]|uniref:Uncharacterized protein n=1 Tax=Algisphaera agarilytica TaxID=1385975 RepID=A0A7X0H4Z6_9BACT|nr:hypothetical protein [Algisphaera agarilytica]MBB6428241.1 hypothetical protein [Algisphaera agarilytica]